MAQKRKLVTLVALETFTPYRAGEVFSVSEEDAEKLLTRNNEKNDFGAKYPKVKVRKFDPRVDGERLLDEHSLNVKAHNALQAKLRPNLPPVEAQSSEVVNDITKLLDDAGYVPEEPNTAENEERKATSPSPRGNGRSKAA
jgi:predicted ArsR family transcriptional regulator